MAQQREEECCWLGTQREPRDQERRHHKALSVHCAAIDGSPSGLRSGHAQDPESDLGGVLATLPGFGFLLSDAPIVGVTW